jgi:hypothetical protein
MTYRSLSKVWCVAVFFTHFFFLHNTLGKLLDKLLGSEDVLALIRDGGDRPIGIAEAEVLAGTLIPNTAVGVEVNQMHLVWATLAGYEEACRAIEEPASQRLGWFAFYLM